ncbi:MAG: thioredoxin-disulfide reductase [Rickettsiaceae bacterium]|nr:thioredoxin-disulfide reductase [Rickettsiaceae bacterium]
MENKHTKLLIIGSGPAGCSAAIYAARANLNPIMIAGMQAGGQLTTTTEVENYPGFYEAIQGPHLMDQMIKQAGKYGTEIIFDDVNTVDFSARPFTAKTSDCTYTADTVVITTGAQAKWLGIPSEDKFKGYGVSGCATCDGFFFKNQKVIVIGGGNTAVEEALYLTNHASSVTLIHRRDSLRAESILQKRLFSNPKISVMWNSRLVEVLGNQSPKKVTAAIIENLETRQQTQMDVSGIFVAIGHKPSSELFNKYLDVDNEGYIITHPNSTKTNIQGVFAAGDVQDKIFRQAATAVGTGCMAALEAEKFLNLSD